MLFFPKIELAFARSRGNSRLSYIFMLNTKHNKISVYCAALAAMVGFTPGVFAGEADIKIPDLTGVKFDGLGGIQGLP